MTIDVELPPAARSVLEGTEWGVLEHAEGSARDLPTVLVGLLHEDAEVQRDAYEKLQRAVGNVVTAYTSSAPTALFLAAVLGDPRTSTSVPGPWDTCWSLRAGLISTIGTIASFGNSWSPRPSPRKEACKEIRPDLYAALSPYFDDPDPVVRRVALRAAVELVEDPRLAGRFPVETDLPPAARARIADTEWGELEHAYGRALDTPVQLTQLLDRDLHVRSEAFGALVASVHHQNSLYSSTLPAALFLAAILNDPRTLAPVALGHSGDGAVTMPLRVLILRQLGSMAEDSSWEEESEFASVRPDLHRAVAPFLEDPDEGVRTTALYAVMHLLKAPELAAEVPRTARLLRAVLDGDTHRNERVPLVRCLGEWSQDTSDLLDDRDPAVRACAAVLPGDREDRRAAQVIRETLTDPDAVESWDLACPWWSFGHPTLFELLAAAVGHAESFEELFPVLLPSLPFLFEGTQRWFWDGDQHRFLDPLREMLFPAGLAAVTELAFVERVFLSTLVELAGGAERAADWLNGGYGWADDRDDLLRVLALA